MHMHHIYLFICHIYSIYRCKQVDYLILHTMYKIIKIYKPIKSEGCLIEVLGNKFRCMGLEYWPYHEGFVCHRKLYIFISLRIYSTTLTIN